MPLTKQYLTYKAECRYGVITGRKGGALLKRGDGGRLIALSPALEGVMLWDVRTSTIVSLATWLDTPTCSLGCMPLQGGLSPISLQETYYM